MIYKGKYTSERGCIYIQLPRLKVCCLIIDKEPYVSLIYPDGRGAYETICLSKKELPELY